MIGRDVCPRPAAPLFAGQAEGPMLLWLLFAVMTAAAVFAVLWPLGRAANVQAGKDICGYLQPLDRNDGSPGRGPHGPAPPHSRASGSVSASYCRSRRR